MSKNIIYKMKRSVVFLFVVICSLGVANAQTTIASGTCGESLSWILTEDSVLTISGSGAMTDYSYGTNPWWNYQYQIKTLILSDSITTISDYAFYFCLNLTGTLTVPNMVTKIGDHAFFYCRNLTGSLTIPNSVKDIGEYAFGSCESFTGTLTLPDSLSSLGTYAFYNCGFTGALNIPYIDTVQEATFYFCEGFTSLTIPSSVTTIGDWAFRRCSGLTSITCNATVPPTLGDNVFEYVSNNIPVDVPCSAITAYQNSTWAAWFSDFGKTINSELCMVSVDDNNHNEIVWKRTETVDSYNIYRENSQMGQYDLVATIDYDSVNHWTDTTSNAKNRSYRYKISSNVDACEYELSDFHRTMHLTINAGQNNSWNLIWTAYEGISYQRYNIYRGTDNNFNNMVLIDSIPAGNTSYSDFPNDTAYVYYVVEIVLDNPCNINKSLTSIRSNIATNNPDPVALKDIETIDFTAFPNPANDRITIESDEKINGVEVVDMLGRMVYQGKETAIDVSNLARGNYFVRVQTEKGTITKKVVKH
jgi:fibronectin type 3 domain-containing protein